MSSVRIARTVLAVLGAAAAALVFTGSALAASAP